MLPNRASSSQWASYPGPHGMEITSDLQIWTAHSAQDTINTTCYWDTLLFVYIHTYRGKTRKNCFSPLLFLFPLSPVSDICWLTIDLPTNHRARGCWTPHNFAPDSSQIELSKLEELVFWLLSALQLSKSIVCRPTWTNFPIQGCIGVNTRKKIMVVALWSDFDQIS